MNKMASSSFLNLEAKPKYGRRAVEYHPKVLNRLLIAESRRAASGCMDGARQRGDGSAEGDGPQGRTPHGMPAARAVPDAADNAIKWRPTRRARRPDPTAVFG